MTYSANTERTLDPTKIFLQFAHMAKQLSGYITGTIDDLCFYKMDGQYYVRMKSSLTGKRVKTGKVFVKTMESAKHLAMSSVMASRLYRQIDKEKRKVGWYRKMTGMAKLLLKEGASEKDIIEMLNSYINAMLKLTEVKQKFVVKVRPGIKSFVRIPYIKCREKEIGQPVPSGSLIRITKYRPRGRMRLRISFET